MLWKRRLISLRQVLKMFGSSFLSSSYIFPKYSSSIVISFFCGLVEPHYYYLSSKDWSYVPVLLPMKADRNGFPFICNITLIWWFLQFQDNKVFVAFHWRGFSLLSSINFSKFPVTVFKAPITTSITSTYFYVHKCSPSHFTSSYLFSFSSSFFALMPDGQDELIT